MKAQQLHSGRCLAWWLLFLSVAGYATGASSWRRSLTQATLPQCQVLTQQQPGIQPSARCDLEIIGRGLGVPGVKSLRLNCTSSSGLPSKVPIGVVSGDNSNKPLAAMAADVAQQLKQHGHGVDLLRSSACQQLAEEPAMAMNVVPMYGLLYFCQGEIEFVEPVIRDLWLPYGVYSRGQEDTAPVVLGGSARVVVQGAQASRVNASTVFAVMQQAELSVERSDFFGNLGNPGSAVFVQNQGVVKISSSNFTNSSSSDYGGAVAAMGCAVVNISDSWFEGCSSKLSGGAVYAIESSSLSIINTTLIRNTAGDPNSEQSRGGAVFCNSKLYLGGGSRLLNNTSWGDGGGVFTSELQLSPDSVISGNSARGADQTGLSAGGGVFFSGPVRVDPGVLRSVAKGNHAARDAEIATDPMELTVLDNLTFVDNYVARPGWREGLLHVRLRLMGEGGFPCSNRKVLAFWDQTAAGSSSNGTAATSGGSLARRLHASNVGAAVYAAASDETLADAVVAADDATPREINRTRADGVVDMELQFVKPPGLHRIWFKVERIRYPLDGNAEVTVHVRNCWPGEEEVQPGMCAVCAPGTYNFQPGKCLPCPQHAMCPGGGVVLSKEGWWQSGPRSVQMHRCPNPAACTSNRSALLLPCDSNNSSSRLGSSVAECQGRDGSYLRVPGGHGSFAQQQCREGYEGNLCGVCAEGHGAARPFACRQCYSRHVIVALYIVACVLLLVLMKLLCWMTLRDTSRQHAAQQASTQQASAQQDTDDKPEPSHLFRQLVLHMQYTLILASVQVADAWPATITRPLQALALIWSPASPETLSPECLVTATPATRSYLKVAFYLILPLSLLVLLLLLETMLYLVRGHLPWQLRRSSFHGGRASVGRLRDRLTAAGMVVVFFFLPSVVRTACGLFACVPIDEQSSPPNMPLAVGRFWLHDTNQQCFMGTHGRLAFILGSFLLLLIAAVPITIACLTLCNRNNFDDLTWREHYGFLVQEYRKKFCFWQAVVASQTIALTAIAVFSHSLGPYYQALCMNAAITIIALMLLAFRPLKHKAALRAAGASLGCLYLTSYTALAFAQNAGRAGLPSDSGLSEAEAAAIPLFMGAVVLAANALYVVWVVWQLVVLFDWSRVRAIAARLFPRLCGSGGGRQQPSGNLLPRPPARGSLPGSAGGGGVVECVPMESEDAAVSVRGGDQARRVEFKDV